jgi:DNA-binding transcriptional MerR regulator
MATELTVQQVVEKTGLSEHTLRYYERAGLIPPIQRASNGHRRYTEEDIGWLNFVKRLRSAGMPIVQVQRYVMLQQHGGLTLEERLEMLREHRRAVSNRAYLFSALLDLPSR